MHSGLPRLPNEEELIERLPGVYRDDRRRRALYRARLCFAAGETADRRAFRRRLGPGRRRGRDPPRRGRRHGLRRPITSRSPTAPSRCCPPPPATCPASTRWSKSGGWGCGFHTGIWKKTLGIIGMGRIGRALARRCSRGFDMRVLAYDPMPDRAYAEAERHRAGRPRDAAPHTPTMSACTSRTPRRTRASSTPSGWR